MHADGPRLLNEDRDRTVAMEALLLTPAVPLDELTHRSPGAYVLLYRGDLPLYELARRPRGRTDLRSISEAGGAPIYVGAATSLAERRGRHEKNLAPCSDIGDDDLLAVALPTSSVAGAFYIERLLMATFRPVWNEPFVSGFGSKPQGASRTRHQRVPRWSVLHPGRHRSVAATDAGHRRRLQQQVVDHLNRTVNDALRVAMPER